MVSVVPFRRLVVHLLVDLLHLLGFLLGDVQANREVVIVLNEFLDRPGPVLQVSTKAFALLGKLLDHVGDLDAIESCLAELLVLTEKALVDPFELGDMRTQVSHHLVRSLELLNKSHAFLLGIEALPAHETTPHCLQVVVLDEGDGKLLTSDEVTEQVLSLERQRVDRVAHSVKSGLC